MNAELLAEVRRLFSPEDPAAEAARARAPEGLRPPTPEIGSLLRWIAVSCQVAAAVEVGSAGGLTGLWLARGLTEKGVLTTIEPDAHAHGLARTAYDEAGLDTRVRAINGQPEAVLPRLTDAAYDLMLIQSAPTGFVEQLEHAKRLLRPGGTLIVRDVLRGGEHAEVLAQFLDQLATDERFVSTVLPIADGLLIATWLGETVA